MFLSSGKMTKACSQALLAVKVHCSLGLSSYEHPHFTATPADSTARLIWTKFPQTRCCETECVAERLDLPVTTRLGLPLTTRLGLPVTTRLGPGGPRGQAGGSPADDQAPSAESWSRF